MNENMTNKNKKRVTKHDQMVKNVWKKLAGDMPTIAE